MNYTTLYTPTRLHVLLYVVLLLTAAACSDDTSESTDPPANTNNSTNSNNGTSTNNNGTNNNTNTSTSDTTGGTTTALDGEVGVEVNSADARSCEIMFQDPDNALGELRTDDSAEGRSMRRGQRVALAFAQTSDVSVATNSVRFALSGTADNITIEQITCFDRAGTPIANPTIELLSNP